MIKQKNGVRHVMTADANKVSQILSDNKKQSNNAHVFKKMIL